jgi:hypothetical protein
MIVAIAMEVEVTVDLEVDHTVLEVVMVTMGIVMVIAMIKTNIVIVIAMEVMDIVMILNAHRVVQYYKNIFLINKDKF